MTRSSIPSLVGAATLCVAFASPAVAQSEPLPTRTLQPIGALAGPWSVLDDSGEPTDLSARYEVVAAGRAVVETMLVGTPEETVTVYHVEDRRVTATQVSGRGGPARLIPGDAAAAGTLRFAADPRTAKPGQTLEILLAPAGADRLRVRWTIAAAEGDKSEPVVHTIELAREAEVAALVGEVARMRTSLDRLQQELDRRMQREVDVRRGRERQKHLETVTLPPGPGWEVSGEPLRRVVHQQVVRYASTFARAGDKGMAVAHYGFEAGPGCRLRFAVLGGHGYVAVVEEEKAPPRRIKEGDIPAFSDRLINGDYGPVLERIVGGRWTDHPRSVVWDLARFEGKRLRLYMVDAATNHFGQIAMSEVTILEDAPAK